MWLNHRSRRTKQFGGGENLPECSKCVLQKKKKFQMYSVFSKKKVFTKIFPLKPSLKRATILELFVAV